jgi:hypothetical protein
MTAGLNCRINVWHIFNIADDVTGGALVTGTLAYQNCEASIAESSQTIMMSQQGYEVPAVFNVQAKIPGNDISERDEIEIVAPYNHELIGLRLKVSGVHLLPYSPSDHRRYVHMSVTRSSFAHSNAGQ